MAPTPRPSSPQRPITPTSKILPFFCQKAASRTRPPLNNTTLSQFQPSPEIRTTPRVFQRFHAVWAAPYRQCRLPCQGIAPPVTIRTAVPVFSSPPAQAVHPQPVCIRQVSTTCSSPLKKVPAAEAEVIGACEVDESQSRQVSKGARDMIMARNDTHTEISDSSSDQGVRL